MIHSSCNSEKPEESNSATQTSVVTLLEPSDEPVPVIDISIIKQALEGSFETLKRYYQEDRKVAMFYIGELVKSHPDKAGAILAQFMEEVTVINRMSFQSRLIELDPFVAFDFATLSFNAAHRGQPQMQALQRMVERGDLESAIEHSKRIGSFRHRAGVMQNVASKMSNDQVYEHADWFASMLPEEKEVAVVGLTVGGSLPTFKELETWPLYDSLGEDVRPVLLTEMARELGDLQSADEVRAAFERFQSIGINQSDREFIENFFGSIIGNLRPEDSLWAIELMQYGGKNLATVTADAMAREAPIKAFDHVSHFPSEYHEAATSQIIETWYENDPGATSTYIADMTAGDQRFYAASKLAELLKGDGQEEEAIHWLEWAEQTESYEGN